MGKYKEAIKKLEKEAEMRIQMAESCERTSLYFKRQASYIQYAIDILKQEQESE
jgi:hypothetical protein